MENDIISCGSCSEVIPSDSTKFACSKCTFFMCETCYLNEENHEHPIQEITGLNEEFVLFSYTDVISGNSLFLGQLPTALPNSQTIKENEIKSVLSVIDFESNPKINEANRNKTTLRNVYYANKRTGYSKTVLHQGILYHHINFPDFANPDLVFDEHYSLPHLLGESIAFIDAALGHGNILIHCERGQYRSPMMILAWLISRGNTTSEGISIIGEEYEDWADKFRKNRPLWIHKFQIFEKKKKNNPFLLE